MNKDQIWPIEVHPYEDVAHIRPGHRIPAFTETTGRGRCENCRDIDGLMFYIHVSQYGPIKHIKDQHGNWHVIRGELKSCACPVCRPYAESRKDDKEKPEEEMPKWIDF